MKSNSDFRCSQITSNQSSLWMVSKCTSPYFIFVADTADSVRRNLFVSCGENLDVEKFHIWWNFGCEENLRYAVAWMVFVLFCRKICSVAIYAVLSRHLFCCDLRTFYVRQIKPKVCSVEEKLQVWCKPLPLTPSCPYWRVDKTLSGQDIQIVFSAVRSISTVRCFLSVSAWTDTMSH